MILESPRFDLPADGADRFRNFVLNVPGGQAHWIRAVELRPENPRVTHHARLGIDAAGESVRRDAADRDPGYEGMAWGQDPPGQLITWTPGMLPDMGAPDAAWRLEPDSKLVLHTHLQPSGKPEQVRFRIGLHYADSAPTEHSLILRIGSRDIDIPADQANHTVIDEYELPIDVDVHFIFPHAHKLCREIQVDAVPPQGPTRTLIAIRHFDEKWHDKYRFAEPVRLPHGAKLVTTFGYDNTAANVRNPHHPPRRVVYGSNADDEMSDVYLQVTPVDPSQYAVLKEHQDQTELRSKIVGYRKTLEIYPTDVWSLEGLASCYVASHQIAEAIRLLEGNPQLLKNSPQATIILGMAQLAEGRAAVAEQTLRQAVAADDQAPMAWLGLAQALVAQRQIDAAEQALRRASELAPRFTVARLDLVDLIVSQERLEEAAAVAQSAIEVAPDDHLPLMKLANIYARQRRYHESLACFAAARKMAPFVYSPQSSLAIACYEFGDEATADRLLKEAASLDADDPVPAFFMGQIARRNSAFPEAREFLQRALDLPIPRTWPASHVRQFLRLVYAEQLQLAQQLDDLELARRVLRAWSKLDPDNVAVRKQLEELNKQPPEVTSTAQHPATE